MQINPLDCSSACSTILCTGAVELVPKAPERAPVIQDCEPSTVRTDPSLHQQQLQREATEQQRAIEVAANTQAKLRAAHRDSLLSYGRRLIEACGQSVIKATMQWAGEQLENPTAGPHHGALLRLAEFRSPEQAVMIALALAVDGLTVNRTFSAVAADVGKALEAEAIAQRMEGKRPSLFHQLRRRMSQQSLLSKYGQRILGAEGDSWGAQGQREAGALLLGLVAQHSGLFTVEMGMEGRYPTRKLYATAAAVAAVKAAGAPLLAIGRTPMVVPPLPWPGLWGGGHLGNEDSIIGRRNLPGHGSTKEQAELRYLEPGMAVALDAVNWLQAQALVLDTEISAAQREAWESPAGKALFGCSRNPPPLPAKLPPGERIGPAMSEAREQAAKHHEDLRQHAPRRMRVERSLQLAAEMGGRTFYQAHSMDFRGRIYAANRHLTHQGPDWEKGQISFLHGEPLNGAGFDALLQAAANHFGEQGSWNDRLLWAQGNLDLIQAVAADPLGKVDLWQYTKDPWQFLQAAKGVALHLSDPTAPIGVPIRYDQTCSGFGIMAALLRDRPTATLCNVLGTRRSDLYRHVAARLEDALQLDLHAPREGREHERELAQFWLARGITRKAVKGPVMAVPYGGRIVSSITSLCRYLEQEGEVGWVPQHHYDRQIYRPAAYLARRLHTQVKELFPRELELLKWTAELARLCATHNQPMQWEGPSGFVLRLGETVPTRNRVATLLNGKRAYLNFNDPPEVGEISGRLTSASATANLIHSFDAALVHVVGQECAWGGIPLLTNHDCFATLPNHAGLLGLHLIDKFEEMYRTNWLARIRCQVIASVRGKAEEKAIPAAFRVGAAFKEQDQPRNPYLFS